MTNFMLLGSVIKKKYPKVVDPLKNLFMKNRYHTPDHEHHVVYQCKCNMGECNSSETYIGNMESTLIVCIENK